MAPNPPNQQQNQRPQEATINATQLNRPASAGAKVVVACKLPHGLRLRLFKEHEERELVMGGGSRAVKVHRALPGSVVVNGVRQAQFGQLTMARIVGGYALTEGVDKDFFDEWMRQNRENPVVVEGLIHGAENADMAVGKAKEQAELRHGLEPLNKDGDPRARRSANPNLANVTEEEDRAKKAAQAA